MLIGDTLHQYYEEYLHVQLHKSSFIKGNILPDLHPRLRSMSHSIYHDLDYVADLSSNMKDLNIDVLSEKIGIMTHFICDFYCAYHFYRNLMNRNIIEHICYESKVHYRFKKDFYHNIEKIHSQREAFFIGDKSNIKEIIHAVRNQYLEFPPSTYVDVQSALLSSILCSEMILGELDFIQPLAAIA